MRSTQMTKITLANGTMLARAASAHVDNDHLYASPTSTASSTKAMKMPPWMAKKAIALARTADRETVERALCRFADLELDLRGGGTLDEHTAVTLAMTRAAA